MLDKLTCADFEKYLEQDFKVDSDEVDMTLKLVEAKVADIQSQSMQAWTDRMFAETDQGLVIREDAREQVEELLARIDQVEKELENDDF